MKEKCVSCTIFCYGKPFGYNVAAARNVNEPVSQSFSFTLCQVDIGEYDFTGKNKVQILSTEKRGKQISTPTRKLFRERLTKDTIAFLSLKPYYKK